MGARCIRSNKNPETGIWLQTENQKQSNQPLESSPTKSSDWKDSEFMSYPVLYFSLVLVLNLYSTTAWLTSVLSEPRKVLFIKT